MTLSLFIPSFEDVWSFASRWVLFLHLFMIQAENPYNNLEYSCVPHEMIPSPYESFAGEGNSLNYADFEASSSSHDYFYDTGVISQAPTRSVLSTRPGIPIAERCKAILQEPYHHILHTFSKPLNTRANW